MLFTGLLQQLLTDVAPPPPAPAGPAVRVEEPVEETEPMRLSGRAHREPPAKSEDDRQIDVTAAALVIVPVPLPLLLTLAPAHVGPGQVTPGSVAKTGDSSSAPLVVADRGPAPDAADRAPAPPPAGEPALVVAVRNTEVAVKAAEVRQAPPERHLEIPESAAPAEAAESPEAVVARPPAKIEAPKPAAMPDRAMPDKPPIRAVAIEFRPDGVHDVRVRLAEHAGEVHVSVHSADPAVTQDLRDNVTGLALTLTQAGYDARTWTPDQGQRQQQPPREERAAKREKRASDTKFDGALEEVSQ
jgi:hypothetical protein